MTPRACKPLALALAAALSGCGGTAQPDGAPTPRAQVRTAVAVGGSLAPIAVAYGTAVAAARRTRVLVMPYEGVIGSVDVHAGDAVRLGQTIVTLARTPATGARFSQARSALGFAEQDLARLQRLYADQLATNEQLAAASKALDDARAQLQALSLTGADQEQTALRSPFSGVITSLAATPGDRPAAGTAIATVSSRDDMIVQLGLEPRDAARLAPGAPVWLMRSADDAQPIQTRLIAVGRSLDAASRLVNAVAPLPAPAGAGITLGSIVAARIELPAHQGVIVPRAALLEDAEGTFVFTVAAGKAHRQSVQLGAETERSVLLAAGLEAGAQVVVAGNAALQDGLAVAASEGDAAARTHDGGQAAEPAP